MTKAIPTLQGRGMTMSDQLARHARTTPDAVALRFERNPSGKVLKTQLRQQHSAGSLVAAPEVDLPRSAGTPG